MTVISANNPARYIPIVNQGNLYVDGLQTIQSGDFTQRIFAGQARDSTNSNDIVVPNALQINIDTIGPNGLDQGILAPQTFYAVYVIGDSTGANPSAGLFSLNYKTSPLMPVGYDLFRRIGWMLTTATIQVKTVRLWQMGTGKTRTYYYDAANPIVLTNGHATSPTAVSVASAFPIASTAAGANLSVEAYAIVTYTTASSANTVTFGASTNINGPTVVLSNGSVSTMIHPVWLPVRISGNPALPTFQYKTTSTSDSVSVAICAFRDYL